MTPAAFAYTRPAALPEALAAVAGGARPIAGGQSLGPMLNLRLVQPGTVADLRRLEALRGVATLPDGTVRLGAATTHAEVEDGAVPGRLGAILAGAARRIAYRAVRNRGTVGGSLAHADPAADWVAVLPALGATVVIVGPGGERRAPAASLVTGVFETVLQDGELVLAVELPPLPDAARWGHWKFVRKTGEFSKATACVLVVPDRPPRAVLAALETAPLVIENAAALLAEPEAEAARIVAGVGVADPWRAALARTALRRAAEAARA